jgi:exodeoxyribonuclease VII large subunit
VLTGIGHERDSTIVDEVAHAKFDTPSKVIAAIEKLIVRRAREASSAGPLVFLVAVITSDSPTCLVLEFWT